MFFKKYEVIRSPGSENATLAPNIDRDTAKESQHTQLLLTTKELQSPIRRGYDYLEDYKKLETPVGPRFPDGSINWTCDCMGGGTLVAHHCGFHFRKVYKCMMDAETPEDASARCSAQFVDWVSCMRDLNG
ncbi:unnamed protein product [Enterobius vermicularis]|uniref:CHCH domain-containing protein n=1 Tax=Enterobius vermicularis TaxID=51028 RepID=A0A0N4V473_ENTVE|nr:unnamed protein product [Enterobius vermicularis]